MVFVHNEISNFFILSFSLLPTIVNLPSGQTTNNFQRRSRVGRVDKRLNGIPETDFRFRVRVTWGELQDSNRSEGTKPPRREIPYKTDKGQGSENVGEILSRIYSGGGPS